MLSLGHTNEWPQASTRISLVGLRRLGKLGSIDSTKSGSNKKTRAKTHPAETDNPRRVSLDENIPERLWQFGVIGILVVAALLRFYDLDLVPLHHDEGVNGN